jgi:hypothetical protein
MERAGRDGGHDPAPGVRLCLGEVGGQAQPHPAREHCRGRDRRLTVMPSCLSRWRSRAAMTQVRSMQTSIART